MARQVDEMRSHEIDLKSAKEELGKVKCAFKTLSDCNNKMVHATDEWDLIHGVCRSIMKTDGYRMTKVSFADYKTWRTEAHKTSDESSTTLPLIDQGRPFGALNIYPVKPNGCDKEKLKLLAELADDLAVGLVTIRKRVRLKQAETALKESEEKFRSLAEQSPNMIFINKNGRVLYANKRCEDVMGYKRKEFYSPNFNFLNLIAPEFRDLVKTSFKNHMNNEEVNPYEYALIT